jgi:ATP:ADP antiporter, AAA family
MNYVLGALPSRVYTMLNLRKGEERIVIMLILFSFFQFFSVAIFFIAASAIFLTDHDAISNLPYVYIWTSVIMILLGVCFEILERRVNAKYLILGETILLLTVVLFFRLGFLSGGVAWFGLGLIIWHRVMSDFVSDGFNRLALLLFDVRQGKRLFGLISSAEIPANILGYSMASFLVPVINTPNLLLISAAGLLISLVFLLLIVSRKRELILKDEEEETTASEDYPKLKTSLIQKLFHSRFIFSLGVSVFFSVLAFTFIEFAFLSQVDARFTNQQDIVFFIAVIFGAGQIIAFFVKTFLYEFIQRNYGIKVALFALPMTLGVISLATLVEGVLSDSAFLLIWTWVAIMLVSETLKSSLYNTTFISLLQPLSKHIKLKGYNILGSIESLTIGLVGLLLLGMFSVQSLSLIHYALILTIAVMGWIAIIPWLNKNYLYALEDVLKKRIIEGGALQLNNPQTVRVLHEKLRSEYPGEVLYALEILCKDKEVFHADLLAELLVHKLPEVRKEVYSKIEELKIHSLQPLIKQRLKEETQPELKKIVIHTYCALGEAAVVDEIIPLLDDENQHIQTGALVGLICFGGINGIIVAGQRLMEYVNSPDAPTRVFAAHVIGEVGIRNFYHPLLMLLRDDRIEVEKEALRAAGKIRHPQLYQPLLKAVSSPNVFEVAMSSLVKTGDGVIDFIQPELDNAKNSSAHLRRLIYVCGRIGGDRSVNVLKHRLYTPDIEVRNQVVQSSAMAGFKAKTSDREEILKTITKELTDATYFLNCIDVVSMTTQWMKRSNLQLLNSALRIEVNYIKKRLLFLLAFLYNSREILQLWNSLQMKNREKTANALEILDVLASKELTAVILPLLEDFPIAQQLKILNAKYPVKRLSVDDYLLGLILQQDSPVVLPWTRSVAVYLVLQVKVPALIQALEVARQSSNNLIAETAEWTVRNLREENPEVLPMVNYDQQLHTAPLLKNISMSAKLLTIEKVMALKTTGLFRETAEDLLVDIAYILKEVSFKKGERIVEKNEVGTCMFIIYSGSVKVHDGEHHLAKLQTRDFFGELSLLDTEPRSASVTALEDSLLLRIDQHAFYEIMADRMEVIREIMKILCSRLRHQNQEVTKLNEQLGELSR